MSIKDHHTEKLILEAANKVFLEKGFDGARMHEIAEEAKINKALLHYYYRSKEKLFEAVFVNAFYNFVPKIQSIIKADMPFFKKIELFVGQYIEMLEKHPHVPMFVLHELSRNPDHLLELMKVNNLEIASFMSQIKKEVKKGNIIDVEPSTLITRIISLTVFPFISRPILQYVFFNNDIKAYQKLIEKSKKELPIFIINAIKKR